MKVGKIPVASIVLLVYFAAKIIASFSVNKALIRPWIDGAFIGALFVFGLYYLNIYLTAWLRNRKDSLAE
jgi:hypothetical protein